LTTSLSPIFSLVKRRAVRSRKRQQSTDDRDERRGSWKRRMNDLMCRGVFHIMLEQSKMDWLSSYLFLVSPILSFTLRIIFLLVRSFLLVFLHPHPHLHPCLPTHAPALLPASPAASIVLLPPFPLPYHNLITVWAKSDVYSSVSSFGPLRFGGNWAGMLLGWSGLGLGLE